MKRWIGLAVLVFVATAGWRIGEALSPDALSMAVGILFGVLAGVPTALLVMAAPRKLTARGGGTTPATAGASVSDAARRDGLLPAAAAGDRGCAARVGAGWS